MSDRVVLSFGDVCIRSSDVDLLRGSHWLNDTIIAFAFEYFARKTFAHIQNIVSFIGPDTVQLVKFLAPQDIKQLATDLSFDSKDIILLPINDLQSGFEAGGTHWSILVYFRSENLFKHFDPIKGSNEQVSKQISKLLYPSATLEQANCPSQKNSYDCGVYTIILAEAIIQQFKQTKNLTFDFSHVTENSPSLKRKELIKLIENCENC